MPLRYIHGDIPWKPLRLLTFKFFLLFFITKIRVLVRPILDLCRTKAQIKQNTYNSAPTAIMYVDGENKNLIQ